MAPSHSSSAAPYVRDRAPGEARPLRVGVLLESTAPAGWVRHILSELRARASYDLVLIVVERGPNVAITRANGDKASLLTRAWRRWYPEVYPREDAFAPAAIAPADYASEVLYLSHLSGKKPSPFAEHDFAKLTAADLDVIVNLTESGQAHGTGNAARFGLWAFDLDENGRAANSWQRTPERISEHHKQHVIATEIRVQDGPLQGTTLGRAFAGADPNRPYRGENRLFFRRATLLIQRLNALHENGWDYVASAEKTAFPSVPRHATGKFAVVRSTVRTVGRGLLTMVRREFTREQWFIAVRERPEGTDARGDTRGFRVICPPRDRFYADPFVIEHGGKRCIFFEDYRYTLRRGMISCMEIDGSGKCGPASTVLEAPYHLSYPFVFKWQDDIFMMPETSAARRIEVYRALEFPLHWERYAVLMDNVVGYDPTLLHRDGKWWLFVSGMLNHGAENSDLSVFWSEKPFGPWRPHPANPVVSDIQRARPAGAIFEMNGQLYRPGQDCSVNYGRAVTFNRIDVLTERMYREEPVGRIEPEWFRGNVGTHTFNQDGRMQVIDGRVLIWKLGGKSED